MMGGEGATRPRAPVCPLPLQYSAWYIHTPLFVSNVRQGRVGGAEEEGGAFLTHSSTPSPFTPPHPAAAARLQSLYDAWQASNIMGLSCNPGTPGSCTAAELAYLQVRWGRGAGQQQRGIRAGAIPAAHVPPLPLQNFYDVMIQAMQPILSNQPKNGAFLQSCVSGAPVGRGLLCAYPPVPPLLLQFVHVVEDVDVSWSKTLVASQTQAQTVNAWLNASATGQAIDSPWPSNTGCYAN